MDEFKSGYEFFERNVGSFVAANIGDSYINTINDEIDNIVNNLNSFQGFKTGSGALKGDIAEFWHSGTFNINAALNDSKSRTVVDRSHNFASEDITSNFGDKYGLKYYKNGVESAKAQSESIFQRHAEYTAKGGTDSLDNFLSKRNFTNLDSILNDPIYGGQIRIIPKDQLQEAINWLERKINEESAKRPEQVFKYQETLDLLKDRIRNKEGVESIPLSAGDSEKLANIAKDGKIETDKLGLTTEELIKYDYVLQQAFKAGMTAATISMVLKVTPEIFKAIEYLIKAGEIDEKQFRKIGFAAIQGASEGFIRGSVSAAITTACKAGLWGEVWKSVNPSIVGAITVITMDTMKNSFNVVMGKMTNRELANELVKEMFVSTCALVAGGVSQTIIELPVLGFMIGSFLGSMIGSFAYSCGYKTILSFCVDTGFTMFGLVEQNYQLPDEIIREIGIEVFDYDKFQYPMFDYDKNNYIQFSKDVFKYDSINITFMRRGVISVSQIGYV